MTRKADLIFAPTFRMAQRYFIKHQKNYHRYTLVDDVSRIRGIKRGTELLWLRGDISGDYDYTPSQRDLIKELCMEDAMGLISIRFVQFEDPPV